jgi:licheninase
MVLVALVAGCTTAAQRMPTYLPNARPTSSASAHKQPLGVRWGKPVFSYKFNGTRLDTSRWIIYNDPFGTHSGVRRTPQSVTVQNGALRITGHYQAPYGYVGGGVASRFNQTYGKWEVRFRADAGAGWEPVVLLWPQGSPANGEIDMAEIKAPNRHGAGEFLHLGPHSHFAWHHIPPAVNFTKWHTIGVEWLPGRVTFFLDGKQTWSVHGQPGTSSNFVPSTPFHFALQNDAGCAFHNCRPPSGFQGKVVMEVKWVRVWVMPSSRTLTRRQHQNNLAASSSGRAQPGRRQAS